MDITEYIEQRLYEWADWPLRQDEHGLGYPKQTVEARLMELGGFIIKATGGYDAPNYKNAEEIEQYLCELAKQNQVLAHILRANYLLLGTSREKARQLRVSYTQFKVYLAMGRQWLAGRFSRK